MNLFQFLFGSILTVTPGDLEVIAGLGAALVVIVLLYRALVAVVADEESARVAGLPVGLLNALTAALAAVTIAVSTRVVGILLIAALMVLPVIAAWRIAWSLRSTMYVAMAVGLASVLTGITTDLCTGRRRASGLRAAGFSTKIGTASVHVRVFEFGCGELAV